MAAELTQEGFLVASGGGPAAMEAAHLGAAFAGHADLEKVIERLKNNAVAIPNKPLFVNGQIDPTQAAILGRYLAPVVAIINEYGLHGGVGIPTWMYGFEPFTPFAKYIAKYFQNSIREDGLLAVATHGVIYVQGSAGTLQEVFQDACQNFFHSFPVGANTSGYFSPMVFFGDYWNDETKWGSKVKPLMDALFVGSAEAAQLVGFETDIDKTVQRIKSFDPPKPHSTLSRLRRHRGNK